MGFPWDFSWDLMGFSMGNLTLWYSNMVMDNPPTIWSAARHDPVIWDSVRSQKWRECPSAESSSPLKWPSKGYTKFSDPNWTGWANKIEIWKGFDDANWECPTRLCEFGVHTNFWEFPMLYMCMYVCVYIYILCMYVLYWQCAPNTIKGVANKNLRYNQQRDRIQDSSGVAIDFVTWDVPGAWQAWHLVLQCLDGRSRTHVLFELDICAVSQHETAYYPIPDVEAGPVRRFSDGCFRITNLTWNLTNQVGHMNHMGLASRLHFQSKRTKFKITHDL